MAIDRQRIIARFLHGMGEQLSGPFLPSDPEYNTAIAPLPYDPIEAVRLLEEEGWYDSDGDGIRDKVVDGTAYKLRFRLLYPSSGGTTRAICDYISTSLREIGVECLPAGVDVADLSAAFDGKDFDAILLSWSMGEPPDDPRQLWHSQGAFQPGSSNMIGFVNPEVDQLIDRLDYAYEPQERWELYHRLHQILHDEAPYTYLFVPKTALLYRENLQQVFVPAERQDWIPGATIQEPVFRAAWISE